MVVSAKSFIKGTCLVLLAVAASTTIGAQASASAPQLVPNDPGYGEHSGAWLLIHAPEAWSVSQGSPSVTIAILDSGVNPVKDLAKNLVPGWNVVDNDGDTSDQSGHGTGDASVAAAPINDGIGIAGVCGRCKIMPVRIVDSNGNATDLTAAAGVDYAWQHGAQIINLSFARSGPSDPALHQAIVRAKMHGSIVIVSAGNDGRSDEDADHLAFDSQEESICVAGVLLDGTLDPRSNHGSWCDVAAPYAVYGYLRGIVAELGGTSVSAPLVAGIAGLLLSFNPAMSPDQVMFCITSAVTKTGIDLLSGGVVNAYDALVCAGYKPSPPPPPIVKFSVTIVKKGTGHGMVNMTACGPTKARCVVQVDLGTNITLKATPDARSRFVRWLGACTGQSRICALKNVMSAKTATVVFNKK